MTRRAKQGVLAGLAVLSMPAWWLSRPEIDPNAADAERALAQMQTAFTSPSSLMNSKAKWEIERNPDAYADLSIRAAKVSGYAYLRWAPPKLVDALLRRFHTEPPKVRRFIALVVTERAVRSEVGTKYLRDMLTDPDPDVRSAAVNVAAYTHGPTPPLVRGLAEFGEPPTRLAAARAIARRDNWDPEDRRIMQANAASADPEMRACVEYALRTHSPTAEAMRKQLQPLLPALRRLMDSVPK